MRLKLSLIFLLTTAISPAFATDYQAASLVDAVTVFPSGAEVTRLATQALAAGDHTLIFDNLPGDLQAETIRVEGTSDGKVEIASVDSRVVAVPSADSDARRKALEAEMQKLGDERGLLDQAIADAEYQKSLMQQLASGAFTQPAKDGGETKVFGAAELGNLLDLVGGKLQALSKTVMEARLRQRDIDKQVAELQTKLNELAPQEVMRTVVSVHLSAPAATSGTFKLKYRIAEAGWHPIYDARLTSPAKDTAAAIELVRRAEVQQSTTETWDNVLLTLSTARPVGATAAPELQSDQLVWYDRERKSEADGNVLGGARMAAPAPSSMAIGESGVVMKDKLDAAVEQRQAEVQIAGFQALYGIAGRVSIDNTGTAKKVRIATDTLAARLVAVSVPKLDSNAYLTAAFTLGGDTPLLPGPVMLYRDGVYMGQGFLPLLSPGEENKLGFGADDLVKVTRAEVKNLSGEEGLLTTSNVVSRAYDITVKNLHDFTLPVTVMDQMPVSTTEDITVEALPGMTPATTRDVDKKPGVMAWAFDLDAKGEKLIKHGYKIVSPKDIVVGLN